MDKAGSSLSRVGRGLEGGQGFRVGQRTLGRRGVDRRTGEDPFDRHLELLVRQRPRYRADLVDLVRDVSRGKVGPQFAGDPGPQSVVERDPIGEYDEQQELAGTALWFLQMHDHRVNNLL